jgi:hypothetical protein
MEPACATSTPAATWARALLETLDDADAHLRDIIFEAGWAELRAAHASDDDALRASAVLYEQALADLFRVVRAAGLPATALEWSRLKHDWRQAAQTRAVELTLRTALGEALYAAEATPLGAHNDFVAWATAMAAFLRALGQTGAPPATAADDDACLAWAYGRLAHLEEHATFQQAFAEFAGPTSPAVAHQAGLLTQPRFDLVLNAAVRWLADEVGRQRESAR